MEGQYASAYAGARQTYTQGRARLDAIQAVSCLICCPCLCSCTCYVLLDLMAVPFYPKIGLSVQAQLCLPNLAAWVVLTKCLCKVF